MKRVIFLLTIIFSLLIISCEADEEPVQAVTDQPVIEETVITETVENDEVEFIEEEEEEPDLYQEEYLRSINNIETSETVTRQEFEDDKSEILKKINELQKIMDTKDFKSWLKNIDKESIEYYSHPANLRKAQKKLPNKTIQLAHIDDYFYYVFIPSRKRSEVDEIRYISKTNIKAVQVKDDLSTVVYYYFTKIDGKWYVHLPPV